MVASAVDLERMEEALRRDLTSGFWANSNRSTSIQQMLDVLDGATSPTEVERFLWEKVASGDVVQGERWEIEDEEDDKLDSQRFYLTPEYAEKIGVLIQLPNYPQTSLLEIEMATDPRVVKVMQENEEKVNRFHQGLQRQRKEMEGLKEKAEAADRQKQEYDETQELFLQHMQRMNSMMDELIREVESDTSSTERAS